MLNGAEVKLGAGLRFGVEVVQDLVTCLQQLPSGGQRSAVGEHRPLLEELSQARSPALLDPYRIDRWRPVLISEPVICMDQLYQALPRDLNGSVSVREEETKDVRQQ